MSKHLVPDELADVPGDVNSIEKSIAESIQTSSQPADEPREAPKENSNTGRPDWIPAKFWTGDLQESAQKLAGSYGELETAYGRVTNDLGTQRKITDQLILGKRDEDLQPEKTRREVDASELIDHPTETLDSYFQERLAEQQELLDKKLSAIENQLLQDKFSQKHPDYNEVANSQEFADWLMASGSRSYTAQAAAKGDIYAADQLLTEFKTAKKDTPEAPKASAKPKDDLQAARAASTETGSAASGVKPSKVYYRKDLIALKMTKPEVYEDPAFQQEIMQAYAEKRVK